jgi:serine protease Do
MFEPLQKLFQRNKNVLLASAALNIVLMVFILGMVGMLFVFKEGSFRNAAVSIFGDNSVRADIRTAQVGDIQAQESLIVDLVEEHSRAVVSVIARKELPSIEEEGLSFFDDPSQFFDLFGGGSSEEIVSGGSGFFVSADGYIVTNRHVVADEDATYSVLTPDGKEHEVTSIERDPTEDVALLKIDGKDYPYLTFTDSNELKVGQSVVAIGNVLGEFQNSVSVGIVSGLSRSIVAQGGIEGPEYLDEVIQTDAAINPGNSGGPLLDLSGRVVGVNVATAVGSENLSFALPSNLVRDAVDSVMETGKIVRPYLGVRYVTVTRLVQIEHELPIDYGALVMNDDVGESVIDGSPADEAGIRGGDIILSIDGERIDADRTLASIIRDHRIGDDVEIELWRDGETNTITATLEERPESF